MAFSVDGIQETALHRGTAQAFQHHLLIAEEFLTAELRLRDLQMQQFQQRIQLFRRCLTTEAVIQQFTVRPQCEAVLLTE